MIDLPILPAADPCRGCGACCSSITRPPFYVVGDPEWARLKAERPDLVAGIDADRVAWPDVEQERPCLWLDPTSRRCLHYEHRPSICADFEPGEEDCRRHRDRRGIGPWTADDASTGDLP